MKRNNKIKDEYWTESSHTILSYWFCVIAVGIELSLGLMYIDSYFGQMCLLEAGFGLSGLLFLDLLHGRKTIYPKTFKKVHPNTFFRFAITFGVITAIQYLFQIVPLITSTEMALAVVFAAVCEEYFFRGILLEPAFNIGKKSKTKFIVWRYSPQKKKPDKLISYVEIGGIILSAAIFAIFHVNYYDDIRLMVMVFVSGIWLGIAYWWNKDITPVILAHFCLNIIFIYQSYWMVMF